MTAVHVELGCAAVLFNLDGVLVESSPVSQPSGGQEALDAVRVVRRRGVARMITAIPPGRWAVVTAASRPQATEWLRAARLPDPPAMVAGGEPSAEGYLVAVEQMGVPANQCAVVADTHRSVLAARAAGCRVVGIAGEPLGPESGPDLVVASLTDLRTLSDGNTITLHVERRMEGRTW